MSKVDFYFNPVSTLNKDVTNLEFIRGVKEILNSPEKWCKGAYDNPSGAYCLIGAAKKILPCGSHLGAHYKFINAMDEADLKKKHYSIVSFNDDPEVTYDDVMNFLSTIETALIAGESK